MDIDFKAVFDASASALMLLDRELRFVHANRAYLALIAARLDDLVGRRILELYPHDPADPGNPSAQLLRQSLERVFRTGKPDEIAFIPYRVPLVPGGEPKERFWSATHTPIIDARGEVAYVLQETVDVTDLQRLRAPAVDADVLRRARTVQESHAALGFEIERLRRLFEQSPGFVCYLSGPEHVFEISNEAFIKLVGRHDLVGTPIRQALPELAGQGFLELLDRAFQTGAPFVGRALRATLARRPGAVSEEVFVDFSYQPISQPDGQMAGVFVQGYDVTEHRRAEIRQQFFARATEFLGAAGERIDEALIGLARAAVEGFADWCLVDRQEGDQTRRLAVTHADPAKAALARAGFPFPPPPAVSAALPPQPMLMRDITDDDLVQSARGPEHLAWLRAIGPRSGLVLALHSRGQRLGVITFCLGAASARRYDEADRAATSELARLASTALDNALLARERADLLAREQLARERAESANQAKDEFLAMLGHELRNPLSPIVTAVELMKLRGDRESSREQVIIQRQAQHLIRLVDDLLDVSRITRGKVQLERAPTDMATVIARAVEIASPLFEHKQHRLQVDVERGQLVVDGDEVRLSQAVANLLTNAARYTGEGGDIRVAARREGDEVVVRVRDNGIGIPAEMLPRIFDMFVQAPRFSDRAEGGLGLGLTLVRTLVGMHGGSVTAESAGTGQGSEFIIRLPALKDQAVRAAAVAVEREPQPGAPHRILVVDDNEDAAELLAELLGAYGHTVRVAHDGPSALAAAREFRPDVAILDIGLPVMDGYELAAQLRVALGAATPRMIALTGYGQEHDRLRSLEAGFELHLVKPVDRAELFRSLN